MKSVIIEPTDEALLTYELAVPYGLAGGAVMLAAALGRFGYRGWLSALWFALMPVITLVLFAREEQGDPFFWQLLCLLAAVALSRLGPGRGASAPRRGRAGRVTTSGRRSSGKRPATIRTLLQREQSSLGALGLAGPVPNFRLPPCETGDVPLRPAHSGGGLV